MWLEALLDHTGYLSRRPLPDLSPASLDLSVDLSLAPNHRRQPLSPCPFWLFLLFSFLGLSASFPDPSAPFLTLASFLKSTTSLPLSGVLRHHTFVFSSQSLSFPSFRSKAKQHPLGSCLLLSFVLFSPSLLSSSCTPGDLTICKFEEYSSPIHPVLNE